MPPVLSKPSGAAPTALIYITLGALLTVWSGIWFLYLQNTATDNRGLYYVCGGLLGTGVVLLIIGFATGRLGRAARQAELPPQEVTPPAGGPPPVTVANPPGTSVRNT